MIGDANGSVTVQFLNILGNPIGVKGRTLSAATLKYIGSNNEAIDAMSVSSFDDNAGKATMKVGKLELRRGAFYPQITLTDNEKSNMSFRTANMVTVQTTVSFNYF